MYRNYIGPRTLTSNSNEFDEIVASISMPRTPVAHTVTIRTRIELHVSMTTRDLNMMDVDVHVLTRGT